MRCVIEIILGGERVEGCQTCFDAHGGGLGGNLTDRNYAALPPKYIIKRGEPTTTPLHTPQEPFTRGRKMR
jgi:hypothetical protein